MSRGTAISRSMNPGVICDRTNCNDEMDWAIYKGWVVVKVNRQYYSFLRLSCV